MPWLSLFFFWKVCALATPSIFLILLVSDKKVCGNGQRNFKNVGSENDTQYFFDSHIILGGKVKVL